MRKTKIIAALGPSSDTPQKIEVLIKAGMNVDRLNFSHGTHEYHAQVSATVRQVSARLKKPASVLQDLQGPKIRIGTLPNGSVLLKDGATFTISTREMEGTEQIVSTTYRGLP